MKIALVCPYAWDRFGGVQTHVRSLARALATRDHETVVIAPSAGEVATDEPGVRIVGRALPVPANGSVAPLSFGPLAAAGMRRELRDLEPDVVHIHEPLIPSLSLLALWNTDSPTVGTFHAAAESSAGYRMARGLLDRAARRLTVRTAVSDAARALAATYFPGDFEITPNGIDVERFENATAMNLSEGPPSVLFFSRLEKRKGVEVLISAAAQLTDIDFELVVAGDGPQKRAARRLAKSLSVPARFLGGVDEADLPGVYRSATVYCAPALGGESFGIVLLEAMASGLPVVCSDLPGFRAVGSGSAAFVAPGDVDGLAATLRRLLVAPDERAEMAARSRERAALYDWSVLVRDVENIYARAVSAA
ncbi:MAG: glycosyltransferase family 4 protein [Actinobacteria bacterium]|nr:glycosyltransferase family 4 protein [Actinomycetota bacterium]